MANMSKQTKRCLGCHENSTPGIVEDWYASLHSETTPQMALQKDRLTRRMSAESVNENLSGIIVGCYECHGTEVKVSGLKKVSSGPLNVTVPNLLNWPNQGVGRLNPDGSRGACTACHPRHSFSIDIARKPYTLMKPLSIIGSFNGYFMRTLSVMHLQ